jgi:hydroxyisourate hydrolase
VSAVTTHILDTVLGEPAAGVIVRLEQVGAAEIGRGRTDADGRIGDLGPARLPAGTYRLVFETGGYLSVTHVGGPAFFPEVVITFTADGARPHYHVPLLLSPFAYSTYRGS